MTDRLLERELRALRAPDEGEAALRAWGIAAAEFDRADQPPSTRRGRRRALVVAVAAAVLAALAISPAGATVARWVGDRFASPGVKHAQPALVSLPAPGQLLVGSRDGAWVVSSEGSRRLLGPYRDATWSPHGLFVAAVRGHSLIAVDTRGHVRWTLPRVPRPKLPSWSPGDGFRVAYLSGSTLRVVAGDGTGDRLVARNVAAVTPAWHPAGVRHVLSYWTIDGAVVTRDADSGAVLWRTRPTGAHALAVQWSAGGEALMVLAARRIELLAGRTGTLLKELQTGAGQRFTAAQVSPDGTTLAAARYDGASDRSEVSLLAVRGHRWRPRPAFTGVGSFRSLSWSPNGRWLLVTWRAANQWLFLRSAPARHVLAVSNIGRAFEPDRTGTARFPAVSGWCCAP